MKKKLIRQLHAVVCYVLITSGITIGALLCLAPVSCCLSRTGIKIISHDVQFPEIHSFSVVDKEHLNLVCSVPVTFSDLILWERRPDGTPGDAAGSVAVISKPEQSNVTLAVSPPVVSGTEYVLTGCAGDGTGNTVTFSLPFTGYNDHPALLMLSEIRSIRSGSKYEFIELYVLESGSTAGFELVSAADGDSKKYRFPAVEVCKGEFIVVHCRKSEEPQACDETGKSLSVSQSVESCTAARDLWGMETTACIGKSDVILLTAKNGSEIRDAVLFLEEKHEKWPDESFQRAAVRAVSAGVWNGGSEAASAVRCDGTTATRTLSRQNFKVVISSHSISADASDWFVTATGTASPGKKNSSVRFSGK